MAVRIRSLVTSGPVVVPLSTGTSVRLSPGQVSDDMPDVEVANNAKVDKLRRRGLIDVESVAEPEPADRPSAKPAAESSADHAADDSAAQPDARGEADGESRSRSRKRTESSG
jgi:hypothetical protein